MRLLLLSIFALSYHLASPALSQSADEVQRCVWSCLANSSGANSPEYNACVEKRCVGQSKGKQQNQPASEPQTTNRWAVKPLTPDTPPYLDGRTAYVKSADNRLYLNYICGRDGDSHFILAGEVLSDKGLTDGTKISARMTIDSNTAHWFSFGEYEGTLTTEVAPGLSLFKELQKGKKLVIDLTKYSAHFSLKGSSKALSAAIDYCQ